MTRKMDFKDQFIEHILEANRKDGSQTQRVSQKINSLRSTARAKLLSLIREEDISDETEIHIDGWRSEVGDNGDIVLIIKPWVPISHVTKIYQNIQRKLMEKKPRHMSDKNLNALILVVEEMERRSLAGEGIDSLSWRKLMHLVNEHYPEDPHTDERQFYRDVIRTGKNVLYPLCRIEQ